MRCDSEATLLYREAPRGAHARVQRVASALAFFVSGVACTAALGALFVVRPVGELEWAAASVLLPAMLVFGVPAIVLLAALGTQALCARTLEYRDRDGGSHGALTLLWGVCLSGSGEVRGALREAGALVPGLRSLDARGTALEILRALGSQTNERVGATAAPPTRWATDAVVLGAVLGLAARGRVKVSLQSRHGWSRRLFDEPRSHALATRAYLTLNEGVRPEDEEGPFEQALLAALADEAGAVEPRDEAHSTGRFPYRAGLPVQSAAPVALRSVLRALAPSPHATSRAALWALALDGAAVTTGPVRALDALESADDALLAALRGSVREAFDRDFAARAPARLPARLRSYAPRAVAS